jgi:hypothetical protein
MPLVLRAPGGSGELSEAEQEAWVLETFKRLLDT